MNSSWWVLNPAPVRALSQSRCDLAVARHIQRLVGHVHRHLVGPAGPGALAEPWLASGFVQLARPGPERVTALAT